MAHQEAGWDIQQVSSELSFNYNLGRNFEQPQEFDDPNTSISNILEQVIEIQSLMV